jgi:protein-S-isoprenylcysteine O-methyltransferase Ste14
MTNASSSWWRGGRGEWYVAGQVALMALIFFGPRTHSALPPWPMQSSSVWPIVGAALMVAGGSFLVAGIVCIRRHLTPLPYPSEGCALVQSGPFAVVRHPMYAGGLVLALGFALIVRGWLTLLWVALFVPFVIVKSRREERWLAERFGEYPEYQRRVGMLVPHLR